MPTLNISLPEAMKIFVEEQAESSGFNSASEYVYALIIEEQRRKAQDRLEALLMEGLESGEPEEVTPQEWIEIRREVFEGIGEDGRHGQ